MFLYKQTLYRLINLVFKMLFDTEKRVAYQQLPFRSQLKKIIKQYLKELAYKCYNKCF